MSYKEQLLKVLMELPREELLIVKKELELLRRRNTLKLVSGGNPDNPRKRKELKGEFTV